MRIRDIVQRGENKEVAEVKSEKKQTTKQSGLKENGKKKKTRGM